MGVKLKTLSGDKLVSILEGFGFVAVHEVGSHIKLRRLTPEAVETLIVPYHATIPKGTLKAIFNQVSRYVPSAELRKHFYTSTR